MSIMMPAAPTRALVDTPTTEVSQGRVDTFMEAVPVLMKALDKAARAHPFILGASPKLLIPAESDRWQSIP
jgi:3-deoxy-D-manno-octulosonic-acid transferase